MADNVVLNSMSGGDTAAADDIGGVKFQRVKLIHGADGVNAGDVSTVNGLPVNVISSVVVTGDIDVISIPDVVVTSSALPSGASTAALQTTGNTALAAIQTSVQLLDNAIAGNELQVDIVTMPNVTIANASLAVTGTFWQATQPVSLAALPALPAGTNNIGDVDVLSLPALPAGTNNIGDVDIVSSVLPTGAATETTLASIQTAVQLIDNAIADNEMQVDVLTLPALSAGTNNIGDVDVLTLPAVHFQDLYITGQGSQLASGQNVINAVASTGSFDCLNGTTGISYRQVALTITPAAGTVTAGAITIEGSNDNVNFVVVGMNDEASQSTVPVTAITLAANTTRYLRGAIPFRYIRARISTGITGTTTGVQCFSVFSTVPFSAPRLTVTQGTSSNLNVTATQSGNYSVTMAANATTTPAKAQDGVAGATDTGIPALFVRRDTPTALTPIAGDYAFAQCSASGELWTRINAALPAGTNNIGDVDVLTQPARVRTTDAISVAQQTDVLMNGLTALTPKFAKISAAASGDNTLVAFVTSKKIRVLSLFMMSTGTVNAYIRDDTASPVDLIGDATNKLTLTAGAGFVLPYNPLGWCETTSGEGLQLNLSAAIGVAGVLSYVEV